LPDTLLESELFGYKAGAFTDAKSDKLGRFALAQGGTIFLDEIGDISPAMQVRLLRVLQEHVYEPLGATVTEKADVRVIAATNKTLSDLVKEGKFRQDLYYRINVMRMELPPLCKRMEDVPLLIEHLIRRLSLLRNKNISAVSREVLELLMAYNFPGNVRELENILEHAFVLCNDTVIQKQHLPPIVLGHIQSQATTPVDLKNIERDAIIRILAKHNGNRMLAAKELGIHKSTLFRKLKSLQIH
jgi:transcriptional regulator with PAS, ATPase and Fis domain